MSHINFIGSEQISEEANGDLISFLSDNDPSFGLESLFDDEASLSDFPISGTCDFLNFAGRLNFDSIMNEILLYLCNDDIEAAPDCTEPNEFNGYLGPLFSNTSIEHDNQRALMNNLPPQVTRKYYY
jgi:hypothetical protein